MTDEVRTHYGDDTPLDARWYVVHTYSGYENKVKEDLEKTVANRNLQDLILEVKYPTEQVTEFKEGSKKPRTVERKVYPGYVMVKMIMTDRTWYVVRNTTGVTGVVGPGSKPIPLTDEEVTAMGVERIQLEMDVEIGETVRIISGAFANFTGEVTAVDPEKQTVTVVISLFGKETPCELDFVEIQKL
ncbi:MAG: transcription termination/antitermination protein NusG [Clostridia bacterium]|nr:transcription termination/antitermination protein NusG [Clostridia bacterium]